MESKFGIFSEKDGSFSWRKALTGTAALCFLFSVIMYIFGFKEIPPTYQAIITMVFVAYFVKDKLRGAGNGKNT